MLHTHTFNLFFFGRVSLYLSHPYQQTGSHRNFFEETFRRLAEAYEVLAANLTEEDVAG